MLPRKRTVKVAVVGSGLAGLTAAYKLVKGSEHREVQVEVHLFEKVCRLVSACYACPCVFFLPSSIFLCIQVANQNLRVMQLCASGKISLIRLWVATDRCSPIPLRDGVSAQFWP